MRHPARGFLWTAIALAWANPLFAQRNLKDIPDPDPELERKALELAEGFEVNLFASDPQIAKPIQMNFDPQGRLWIASSEVYPQLAPGQKANDRILVVEDTDGDGRADRTTVFADGLLIPTAVEPGDGGAYVANSTELVHLRDTDGDGKADARRVLLSGFGTEDTHHILHTFRWGPDGLLYMNQSIYIHSHLETPYGVRRLNAGGIWQFRPETMRLEVFARGWINSWGHQLDEYGQSFATDGAGGEGINFVVPGAAYPTATGIPRILHGLNPGSPKYCGLEIVGGRHLPEDWQGNLLTNDFRGHRVCRFVLSDDGSGFTAKQLPDLIRTNHPAFRPIDIKMGPDGAIYIADWYNPIIQHGEVDFRDPRRDHVHGRIWRVTAKGRPLVERPKLVDATTDQLLNSLKAPELWTRHQAKRVLKERSTNQVHGKTAGLPGVSKVLSSFPDERDAAAAAFRAGVGSEYLKKNGPTAAALQIWQANLNPDDPLIERHRLEALWSFQSIDVHNAELLSSLLRAKDFRVRAAATRVLGHWADRLPNALDLLAPQATDPHPRVRLEAVRVLGSIRDPQAFSLVLRALDAPIDAWIDYAAWLACRELEPAWLPRLREGRLALGSESTHLPFALKAVGSPAVVPSLVQLVREARLSPPERQNLLELIAELGNPSELRPVFELAVAANTNSEVATPLLAQLAVAARRRNVRPEGDLKLVERLTRSGVPDTLRAAAFRAAGGWKLESSRESLDAAVRNDAVSAGLRIAAIDGIQSLGGPQSVITLRDVARSSPRGVRAAAVAALGALDAKEGAEAAVALLQDLKEAPAEAEPVLLAALARKEGAAALAAALDAQPLPIDVAKVALRALSAAGRAQPGLEAALRTAGGVASGPKTLTPDEMTELITDIRKNGDPAAGELVYRRQSLACQKCHAIGGAGGAVGPDLVSIGASAQPDYLVDSLLAPNKQVKEGFQTLVVETSEGRIFTGIKVRQTDADLILRTIDDREIAVPLKSIEEQVNGTTLMPVGLTDTLTRKELVDLVRFLSELGKVGPYAASREPVVRVWEVVVPDEGAARRFRDAGPVPPVPGDAAFSWQRVYSRVDGTLHPADLPPLVSNGEPAPFTAVRCDFDVTTPGVVRLELAGASGSVRLDQDVVPSDGAVERSLPAGRHVLTFAVDRMAGPLRVRPVDVPGTAARVRLNVPR